MNLVYVLTIFTAIFFLTDQQDSFLESHTLWHKELYTEYYTLKLWHFNSILQVYMKLHYNNIISAALNKEYIQNSL
jgi:hypothetical protein